MVSECPEMRRPVPGRVFVMQAEEADPDTTLITGRIIVSGVATKALLDSGASHSFISEEFVLNWGIQREELLGQSVVADLIVLPMPEFNLILGIDWMVRNAMVIDFQQRSVLIRPEGVKPFWFEVAKSWRKARNISFLQERQLISDGCESFLASLLLRESPVRPVISDLEVVSEFEDVFPDDFAGLPLNREVEFSIELVPSTVPISKAPYRLAPIEINELKEHIKELLVKGFIRPSFSPWDARSCTE
ncbi:uncharacterized protein [Henckelia pumila]|uniref:uncharacterized protein n=1 Tax=Henckelia pumila TaxID=405737 RepID=UPI003C6E420A